MSTILEQQGFEVVDNVLSIETSDALGKSIDEFFSMDESDGRQGGIRNLLRCPAIAELSRSAPFLSMVESRLGQCAFPVRGILFDKTAKANWRVAWHQDITIAVAERREAAGYGPWSVKDGVLHVQPPSEILQDMLTLRLHLDDCDGSNGALHVLPESHLDGKLNSTLIEKWRQRSSPVVCSVAKGGVLVMKPLLLHASFPATSPNHRRVVHIEYAKDQLPDGLRWYED